MPKLRACSASTLPHPLGECRELLYCKRRGRINSLLGNIVVYLDLNPVNARLEIRSCNRFLQSYLIANIAHGVGAFHFLDHRLVRGDVGDVVLDGGGSFVSLLVHAEIIDLHPEIQLLIAVALEDGRLAVGRGDARADLGGADYEITAADRLRRDRLHLVGDDQARGRQLVFDVFGNRDAAAVDTLAVAVDVFDRDVQLVMSRAQGKRLPVDRCVLSSARQELGRNIDLYGVLKGLYDLAGQRRELAIYVHGAALDAIFVDERDVTILHLDGDGDQNSVACHLHEVGADIERHGVQDDLGIDFLGQVREFDLGSSLQFGPLVQTIEFFAVQHRAVGTEAEALDAVAGEALRLVGHAHLLPHGEAGVRRHQQGIFFGTIHRHVIFAAHTGVDEFNDDFLANSLNVAIAPLLEGKGGGGAAALFHGALVGTTGGMGLDFVGLAEDDIDAAAIGSPAGDACCVMLIGIGDALVVLFLKFVLFGVGRGIAALPESFNEVIALFVVRELLEGGTLFIGDDVGDVLVKPLFVGLAQLLLKSLGVLFTLLLVLRAFQRIDGVGRLRLGC